MNRGIYKLFGLLCLLIILAPLGLLTDQDAWGEWSYETLKNAVGYIPSGLKHLSGIYSAPFEDYGIHGFSEPVGYILSAVIGIVLIVVFLYLFSVFSAKKAK